MTRSKQKSLAAEKRRKTTLSVVLACICIIYVLPVLSVVINSFKANTYVKTDTFALPTGEMWVGFDNFTKGMTFGGLIRNGEASLVSGGTQFQTDDSVIVFCRDANMKKVEDLFI